MKKGILFNRKTINKQLKKSNNTRNANKVRANYMDRWARLSGLEPNEHGKYDYSKIDWTNKYIRLEHLLCNPRILTRLGNDNTRADCIANDIPDDLKETFYSIGPGQSAPYSSLKLNKETGELEIKRMKEEAKAQKREMRERNE